MSTDPEEKEIFRTPDWMLKMADKNYLGNKSGAGFYKKQETGQTVINIKTLEYEPLQKISYPSLNEAGKAEGTAAKMNALVFGADKAAFIAWKLQKQLLLYAADLLGVSLPKTRLPLIMQ